jgi:hypothetical protein
VADHTHETAATQFVDGAGVRFAYRRFGKNQGVPLVFFQHFTGTMDDWDPAVTDGLARDREVILFNNAGSPALAGKRQTLSLRWHGMRPHSSMHSGSSTSISWAFRSEDSLPSS